MKEYDVTITETLEMTVAVEAESREEAQQIASDNWKNGDYILDADHSKTWYSAPKTGAVTGASGEILFSRARFPQGEWDVYVQQASCLVAQTPLVRGAPPNTPLKEWRFSMEGLFFAIGFLLGGVCGVLVMCLLQINRRYYEEDKE